MCPSTKTRVAAQEQDKVAKENAKFKSKIKVQIKHGGKKKKMQKSKTYQTADRKNMNRSMDADIQWMDKEWRENTD